MTTDNFWLISKQNIFYLCSLIPINTILQANDACFSLEASKRKIRPYYIYSSFVCLFFRLFVIFRPIWEFFTHMETSQLLVKAANFDLCSALIAIEQWGFFSVPHLLWHGASSPRTRDTHTNWSAFCTGAVSTCFYDLGLSRLGFEHPTFSLRDARSNWLRHRHGLFVVNTCINKGIIAVN